MGYYINCIKRDSSLSRDIKELIPNMNIRRRMSRVIKSGVTTALDSLMDFEEYGEIDAIITSTWLGCIADSEKFLANIISSNEQLLNPTPFIQSTFNTVGAQVALIKSLKCYNNTFTHGTNSFESALLEAALMIDNGDVNAALIGFFDEVTPTVEKICERLGVLNDRKLWEGALFFVLTKDKLDSSIAEIEQISLECNNGGEVSGVDKNNSTIVDEFINYFEKKTVQPVDIKGDLIALRIKWLY